MFQEWLKDYKKLREENNMSEEEIIQEIRDNITDNEGKYMLCDALEDIIKNNNKKYDIQIIVSGLLDLYKAEKEKNKKIEDKIKVKLEKLKGQKGQYRLMLEQEYKGLLEE